MSGDAPRLTVVIPTRNRPAFVRDCLVALAASTERHVEVRVMDQSDGDETRDVVDGMADGRFVYQRMPRLGACPARNLGAAQARAGVVAFLDDDCAPPPDWAATILHHFEGDSGLQFLFGDMVAPAEYPAGGEVPECRPSRLPGDAGVRDVMRACTGGNMAARKALLRQVGGFDEMLGPSQPWVRCNDVSLAYKVVRSGARWAAPDDTAVVHLHGFRTHAAMADVQESAMFGAGVHWGRALRRRDFAALGHFAAAEWGLLRRPAGSLLRLRRPDGVRPALMHLRGFVAGLRLRAGVGLVDGAEFRRIEATGELDQAGGPDAGHGTRGPKAVSSWS